MPLFIFDMGGVVTGNVACIPAMASKVGLGVDDFFRAAGSDPQVTHTSPYNLGDVGELMKGTISPRTFWERFEARSGPRVAEDLWGAFFHPQRDEGTYGAIADLKARGYRVVCGTNSIHAHYEIHLARGDYACFDAVYASHLMGLIKPDPEFWRRILTEEGVSAGDAFFVDDLLENVRAAELLGLGTHRFTDSRTLVQALQDWIAP